MRLEKWQEHGEECWWIYKGHREAGKRRSRSTQDNWNFDTLWEWPLVDIDDDRGIPTPECCNGNTSNGSLATLELFGNFRVYYRCRQRQSKISFEAWIHIRGRHRYRGFSP
jgi:hypothetical protein